MLVSKVPARYFWEKMKQAELTKLLRSRDLSVEDVIMSDSFNTDDTQN
jgi:hypothetical protein